jgi:hypothetical protein
MSWSVGSYSAHATKQIEPASARCLEYDARIRRDRDFLVLWRCHGKSGRNYFAGARHGSRSSLEAQSDCVQATPASGPYRWDSLLLTQRSPHHGRNRMVSTSPLGMETSGRNHLDAGSRGCRQLRKRRLAAWRNWRPHRRRTIAVSLAAKSPSHVYLESLSKLKKAITDKRGNRGNFKIGSGENISDCPHDSPLPCSA